MHCKMPLSSFASIAIGVTSGDKDVEWRAYELDEGPSSGLDIHGEVVADGESLVDPRR